MSDTIAGLRDFLGTNVSDADAIDPETSLIESGLLDSIGILQMVEHIEVTYGVEIAPDEVTLENFDSLADIAHLIDSKR